MAEVQQHGNKFEDMIIQNLMGMTKSDYERINGGYTSEFDISQSELCDHNYSIKVTGNGGVGCGDIVRFQHHCLNSEFKLVVAIWNQVDKNTKVFEAVYEFDINPEVGKMIFGDVPQEVISEFRDYVKSIPNGKQGQLDNKDLWKQKRNVIKENYNTGAIAIDAKIDSKNQRRVQCSVRVQNLIDLGVPYTKHTSEYLGIDLPFTVDSAPRTFNK